MTPAEMAHVFRFFALLCAWMLLGGLIGLAVIVELIRPRTPASPAVSGYTIGVTVLNVMAIAYMFAGDTP